LIIDTICKNTFDKKTYVYFDYSEQEETFTLSLSIDKNLSINNFESDDNKIIFRILSNLLDEFKAKFKYDNSSNSVRFEIEFSKDILVKENTEIIQKPAENETKNEKTFSLLIAEDDEINQKIYTMGFQKYFDKIDIAANGVDVINFLSEKRYDLLLMDLQMPKLNGIETIIKIREMEKLTGQHLIVIGISANVLIYNKEEIINFGYDDYFVKPFKIKNIFDTFIELNINLKK
jgi:CheY-like chemotaxis protein